MCGFFFERRTHDKTKEFHREKKTLNNLFLARHWFLITGGGGKKAYRPAQHPASVGRRDFFRF